MSNFAPGGPGKIQANYNELERMAAALRQQADGINQLRQRVAQTTNQLQQGDWVGKGAQSFYREMNELVLPGVRRLGEALQQASAAVSRVNTTFRNAEAEASHSFDNVGGAVQTRPRGAVFGGPGPLNAPPPIQPAQPNPAPAGNVNPANDPADAENIDLSDLADQLVSHEQGHIWENRMDK